jgi:hypothetical protein
MLYDSDIATRNRAENMTYAEVQTLSTEQIARALAQIERNPLMIADYSRMATLRRALADTNYRPVQVGDAVEYATYWL